VNVNKAQKVKIQLTLKVQLIQKSRQNNLRILTFSNRMSS